MTSYSKIESMISERYFEIKACGANRTGGGGFQVGNTCARGGKAEAVVGYWSQGKLHLSDGHHRYAAGKLLGVSVSINTSEE